MLIGQVSVIILSTTRPLWITFVQSVERWRQRMAIVAEHHKVVNPVIFPVAVDVVYGQDGLV